MLKPAVQTWRNCNIGSFGKSAIGLRAIRSRNNRAIVPFYVCISLTHSLNGFRDFTNGFCGRIFIRNGDATMAANATSAPKIRAPTQSQKHLAYVENPAPPTLRPSAYRATTIGSLPSWGILAEASGFSSWPNVRSATSLNERGSELALVGPAVLWV